MSQKFTFWMGDPKSNDKQEDSTAAGSVCLLVEENGCLRIGLTEMWGRVKVSLEPPFHD